MKVLKLKPMKAFYQLRFCSNYQKNVQWENRMTVGSRATATLQGLNKKNKQILVLVSSVTDEFS